MKINKAPTSVRIDKKLIKEAKDLGLNVSQIIEATLSAVTDSKICPCCGTHLKKKALK